MENEALSKDVHSEIIFRIERMCGVQIFTLLFWLVY